MIKATEANRMTTEILNNKLENDLFGIENKIKEAINEGKYSANYSGTLKQEVKDFLIQNGYKIETGSQYNEEYYHIRW